MSSEETDYSLPSNILFLNAGWKYCTNTQKHKNTLTLIRSQKCITDTVFKVGLYWSSPLSQKTIQPLSNSEFGLLNYQVHRIAIAQWAIYGMLCTVPSTVQCAFRDFW